MTLNNILDQALGNLEPIHGRELMTAAYLLNYHGYTFLAEQVRELAEQVLMKETK